ncbi:hypothetical protein QAD02_000032 [Eretmocerus hayati]|uniref:Uncharacterized protein n=1 Tax=Eretmocerus hayati TaxID=131215 RepID=A0ACC2NCT6_9HYME|nr:hypothetical protein QAD02_000032 [Eretmocerus hayati]
MGNKSVETLQSAVTGIDNLVNIAGRIDKKQDDSKKIQSEMLSAMKDVLNIVTKFYSSQKADEQRFPEQETALKGKENDPKHEEKIDEEHETLSQASWEYSYENRIYAVGTTDVATVFTTIFTVPWLSENCCVTNYLEPRCGVLPLDHYLVLEIRLSRSSIRLRAMVELSLSQFPPSSPLPRA